MKLATNLMVLGSAMLVVCAHGAAAQAREAARSNAVAPAAIAGQKVDRQLTRRVESVLNSDPYLDVDHVIVTSNDGVVTLRGQVADSWDLLTALRLSNGVAGVKRVDDELQISDIGESGGHG